MSELDEIRQRVSALEAQVTELRAVREQTHGESRRAAELFGMVDRDVADLTAKFTSQTRMLQALRTTQVEQGQVLEQIKQDHGDKLNHIVALLTRLLPDQDG